MPTWFRICFSSSYRRSASSSFVEWYARWTLRVAVERDPVLGHREVLGGEPEVDGVLGDVAEAPVRREHRELGLLALHRLRVRLADHLDVAGRPLVVVGGEVEVVDAERLLEDGLVELLRERDDRLAVVEHVVATDLVGAVGEPVRVPVVRRAQQDLGAVRRARRRPRRRRPRRPPGRRLASTTTPRDGADRRRRCWSCVDLGVDEQRHVRAGRGSGGPRSSRRRTWRAPGTGTRRTRCSGCTCSSRGSASSSRMPHGA